MFENWNEKKKRNKKAKKETEESHVDENEFFECTRRFESDINSMNGTREKKDYLLLIFVKNSYLSFFSTALKGWNRPKNRRRSRRRGIYLPPPPLRAPSLLAGVP